MGWKKLIGCVDIGDGGSSDVMATHILVFMVVCVNQSWKIPLGYFPIHSLTSLQKKNIIVLCVQNIVATGAQLVGVTFDGTSPNISTMALLGCNILDIESSPIIKINNDDFLVIPDTVHMLKLVRNSFGDIKVFFNENGECINWKYVVSLLNLQDEEQLPVGNKLRQAHIYFRNQKMRVKLAVQLLSKSVSDAIDFCRIVLKLPDFYWSGPTTNFIRIMNNKFNVLNTGGFGFTESISERNYFEINNFVKSTIKYIRNIRTSEGVLLIEHRRKTGFVGLITSLKTIEPLYERYILTGIFKFVPYYKLNQDHIELFFGSIRVHFGYNNNPTVRQFQSSYKRFLIRCQLRDGGIGGNCMPLEDIEILHFTATNASKIMNETIPRAGMIDQSVDEEDYNSYLEKYSQCFIIEELSEYCTKVVEFISGFVVKKLKKKH